MHAELPRLVAGGGDDAAVTAKVKAKAKSRRKAARPAAAKAVTVAEPVQAVAEPSGHLVVEGELREVG